ncbi:histidine kinase N-terminal 7TM domain-containing protein [Halorientalis halophila]|uniref:histidine kinase N-terminal 7TM domain-containing protein n=1 Tax=Halorientalis halophila TaxID=3108499 RepID=UPI00300906EE
MPWQVTPYTVLLSLSTLLGVAVTAVVWRERPKRGTTWLSATAFAITLWAAGQVVVVSTTAVEPRLLGNRLTMTGAIAIPSLFLLFTLAYTGRAEETSGSLRALIVLEPLVVIALVLVGHDLVSPEVTLALGRGEAFGAFGYDLMTAHYAFGNALLFVNEYFLYKMFLRSRNVFRKRTFFLLALLVVLHVSHLVTVLGLSPTPYYTLTPLGFLLFGTLSLVVTVSYRTLSFLPLQRVMALFGGHSKTLAPLARDQAIEEMGTGFLVVDHQGRIVDTNPLGKRMLGRSDSRVVGKDLETVIPPDLFVDGIPEFMTVAPGEVVNGRYTGLWIEPDDGDPRCFDVLVSALTEDGEMHGYVALIHDVTERERRKRVLERRTDELERQNDQLEDFAGIVSHDLRNPMNVIGGRLQIVDAGDDQEHLDEAEQALARMEAIVDDVLTFARLGKTIDDTEPLDLATLARDAWGNVDTRDATLDVEADVTVEASHGRLLQVFENLFRNAIEHAGPDVTVTVGTFDGGFYVADDGPGISPDDRERVLEQGFSSRPEGTGFGLAIVRTIVEAHGWEITVTESDGGSEDDQRSSSGGARFEITGEIRPGERDTGPNPSDR